MEHSYAAGLIVAGIINTIPVSGVLSGAQLQKLYGLPFAAADPNTKLLLQHRAVLFGIVGGLSFAVSLLAACCLGNYPRMLHFACCNVFSAMQAVARPELRPAALVSGLTR